MNINDTNLSTTKLMNEEKPPTMTKKIGNTTYVVKIHFSKTSKEDFTDKVIRLIRNDISSKSI